MNKTALKFTTYAGIFLLVSGITYFAFNFFNSNKTASTTTPAENQVAQTQPQTGVLQFSGPKTEMCPMNGTLHTQEEKDIWSKRRPLIVMIENHSDARPQSGLQSADIVYEAVAEGAITRFMAVFYCGILSGTPNKYDVGPVRSARTYFMDLASEYADFPLYAHVGGGNCSAPLDPKTGKQVGPCTTNIKAQAIEQIAAYGWNDKGTWSDLSQFSLSYKVCRREPERTGAEKATEHTMYCSTNELWNTAADRGLTNLTQVNNTSWDKSFKVWSFKQSDQAAATTVTPKISFDFWTGYKDYSVSWAYDKTANNYARSNGGQPHIDFNTGKIITAKNVVIEFTKETRNIDEHLHNLYDVIGAGKGILYQNGTKQDISWSKASRTARTIFKDASGQEVNFVPGNIWIEILPINTPVTYEGN